MEQIGFDHVGILVPDFDDVLGLARTLGWTVETVDEIPADAGMEAILVTVGGVHLEFLRPTRPDSRVSEILARGDGGVHHVAITVRDAGAALATLAAQGLPLRDTVPREGIHGSRIGFAEVGGALLEVVEPAADAEAAR
jgi:methylmalonyl-CoA/ethylmalonyl-CoA epimerase